MNKVKKHRQSILDKNFINTIIINIFIVLIIILSVLSVKISENNEIEGETQEITYESINHDHEVIVPPATVLSDENIVKEEVIVTYSYCRNLSDNDKYLLAKIAMAEAEGESLETKILVILTILNRVDSNCFPNTIEEVIFQNNGVYQFSPVESGGRWWTTEPNEECWEAVEIVNSMENDTSNGALYFESCLGESWHSRNLEFVCEIDNTRFYK